MVSHSRHRQAVRQLLFPGLIASRVIFLVRIYPVNALSCPDQKSSETTALRDAAEGSKGAQINWRERENHARSVSDRTTI
jgi:hypothetical protein